MKVGHREWRLEATVVLWEGAESGHTSVTASENLGVSLGRKSQSAVQAPGALAAGVGHPLAPSVISA